MTWPAKKDAYAVTIEGNPNQVQFTSEENETGMIDVILLEQLTEEDENKQNEDGDGNITEIWPARFKLKIVMPNNPTNRWQIKAELQTKRFDV